MSLDLKYCNFLKIIVVQALQAYDISIFGLGEVLKYEFRCINLPIKTESLKLFGIVLTWFEVVT